jgi:hypothetical protein
VIDGSFFLDFLSIVSSQTDACYIHGRGHGIVEWVVFQWWSPGVLDPGLGYVMTFSLESQTVITAFVTC